MSDLLIQSLVTIVTTIFGYGAVAGKLRGKLDTVIYQQGAKNTWDEINSHREKIVELRTENIALRKDVDELRTEMRVLMAKP